LRLQSVRLLHEELEEGKAVLLRSGLELQVQRRRLHDLSVGAEGIDAAKAAQVIADRDLERSRAPVSSASCPFSFSSVRVVQRSTTLSETFPSLAHRSCSQSCSAPARRAYCSRSTSCSRTLLAFDVQHVVAAQAVALPADTGAMAMANKLKKVPVTARAVLQRVNRKLAGTRTRKSRRLLRG
jgi:hypothetical protein